MIKTLYYLVCILILYTVYSIVINVYFNPTYSKYSLIIMIYLIPDIIFLVGGIGLFFRKKWARITTLIIIPIKLLLGFLAMAGFVIATTMYRNKFSLGHFVKGILLNFLLPIVLFICCFVLLLHPTIKSIYQTQKLHRNITFSDNS